MWNSCLCCWSDTPQEPALYSLLADAARQAAVVFVAVGTPLSGDGRTDISVLEAVCSDLVNHVGGSRLVVVKSTVPVGTNRRIRRLLHKNLPLCRTTFPGTNAIPAPDQARVPARVLVTKPVSAELIKQAANAFLATKISFINAIAHVCEAHGADVDEVAEGIGSDQRIGAEFLRPGIGYGGSCFPKDLRAFCTAARDSDFDFRLLEEVGRINEEQRQRFVRKVRHVLRNLKGKKLAVSGLAFKGGTDDVRESPAIAIVRSLLKEGCENRGTRSRRPGSGPRRVYGGLQNLLRGERL